jgi:hypothetical protein
MTLKNLGMSRYFKYPFVKMGVLGFGLFGFFCLGSCQRNTTKDNPDQAFIQSQIPPGLAPQYYPPMGFVWSGFKVNSLPEARYGVASPPVNPRAQLLILADASYPAEIYYELSQFAISQGLGVWIIEAPGQGGAGSYMMQSQKVHSPDFKNNLNVSEALIAQMIRPTKSKPLYVFGHGSGALTALNLHAKQGLIAATLIYEPWLGKQSLDDAVWRREVVPQDDLGKVAYRWQVANPDLRRMAKSEAWEKSALDDLSRIKGLSLAKLNPVSKRPPLEIYSYTPQAAQLCLGRTPCKSKNIKNYNELVDGFEIFISQKIY